MRILLIAFVLSASVAAQVPNFQRGDSVRALPAGSPSEPATTLVLRVVAIPNDRIHIVNSRLYVNDTPVTGFSADFLDRVASNKPARDQSMPAGHYFVMGEQRINGDVSEHSGMHPGTSLAKVP